MTKFDPEKAREKYAGTESEELVRIAFIEDSYLPEAKNIAIAELERRDQLSQKDELIRKVRAEIAQENVPFETSGQRSVRTFEYGVYVAMIWVFAAALPVMVRDPKTTMSGAWLLIIACCWLFFGYFAYKEWQGGTTRPIYLVVVVPICLLTLSAALNLLIWKAT